MLVCTKKLGFKTVYLLGAFCVSFSILSANLEESWTPQTTYAQIIARAQAKSPYYQGLLAIYLRAGEEGLAVNLKLSEEWSHVAAQKDHPFGHYNLANLALNEGKFEEATEYYQEAALRLERWASSGDPVALFCMGEIDFQVKPINLPRAVEHFRKSAEVGFPLAQATLGSLCLKGLGISGHDARKGIQLLEAAARRGSLSARFNLGMAHYHGDYNGDGVTRDVGKAAILFRHAAVKQNFTEAQYILGMLLIEGDDGLAKNQTEGMRLLRLAAGQRHLGAKEELRKRDSDFNNQNPLSTAKIFIPNPRPSKLEEAQKYYAGEGVRQDYKRAFGLFSSLARAGNAEAARYLGLMLLTGRGCEKNTTQAKDWLLWSSAAGDVPAARYLSQYAPLFKKAPPKP